VPVWGDYLDGLLGTNDHGQMPVLSLVGRERELSVIGDLVDRAGVRGGMLVVRSGAGIGKSSLLAAAPRCARDRGCWS
jgi:hypothetical protein